MLYQNENKPDVYHVDASKIQDLTSFHEVFAQACNFPDFYGKNFDAWHDCLSDIHHDTTIIFEHFGIFKQRCPDIAWRVLAGIAEVNYDRIEYGMRPCLMVALVDQD